MRKRIGYTCSYLPVEIVAAAGMDFWKIIPGEVTPEGDSLIHQNTCSVVKGFLSEALGGGFSGLDGIILVNSCDGMRRLADLLRDRLEGMPLMLLDVPKKRDPESVSYFTSELKRLVEWIEGEFRGTSIDEEGLRNAIEGCNEVRSRMAAVFEAQRERSGGGSGLDVFDLSLRGTRSDAGSFIPSVNAFLQGKGKDDRKGEGPRIVVTGNAPHEEEIIGRIEKMGGAVTALDTCIGERHYGALVHCDGVDPILALAERYTGKPPCSRMDGIDERIGRLRKVVKDSGADGVVCLVPKYCDTLLYEMPLLRDGAGVPFMALETDLTRQNEAVINRLDAFLEMLEGGGENA